jgi:alpha-beta hydrolase superfamily lysophospholipase
MARRVRRPPIKSLIAQVEAAGRKVKRIVYPPQGEFELVFDDDEPKAAAANDVEQWFAKNAS